MGNFLLVCKFKLWPDIIRLFWLDWRFRHFVNLFSGLHDLLVSYFLDCAIEYIFILKIVWWCRFRQSVFLFSFVWLLRFWRIYRFKQQSDLWLILRLILSLMIDLIRLRNRHIFWIFSLYFFFSRSNLIVLLPIVEATKNFFCNLFDLLIFASKIKLSLRRYLS